MNRGMGTSAAAGDLNSAVIQAKIPALQRVRALSCQQKRVQSRPQCIQYCNLAVHAHDVPSSEAHEAPSDGRLMRFLPAATLLTRQHESPISSSQCVPVGGGDRPQEPKKYPATPPGRQQGTRDGRGRNIAPRERGPGGGRFRPRRFVQDAV